MKKAFREGNIGALMDEYERAATELARVVEDLSEEDFEEILDAETPDADCRSVQSIMAHVVGAGYSYADYLRELFSVASERPANRLYSHSESLEQLASMLDYTVQTLDGRWVMSDEEIDNSVIKARWGVTYDLEQLLEHAAVHILRHRRQIEKLTQARNKGQDNPSNSLSLQ